MTMTVVMDLDRVLAGREGTFDEDLVGGGFNSLEHKCGRG